MSALVVDKEKLRLNHMGTFETRYQENGLNLKAIINAKKVKLTKKRECRLATYQ